MPVLIPDSFADACWLMAEQPQSIALAGGTDLLQNWPARFDRHDATLVDLSKLEELKTIEWTNDALVLGAATTYWDVLEDARIGDAFPILASAARQVGALQVQTRGTWAGNVATAAPSADGAAVLLALDAALELVSSRGREEVALSEFYRESFRTRRQPDQLIRSIRIPLREYTLQCFEKVGARAAQTVSVVSATLARSSSGWRAVAGGMSRNVTRCSHVEQQIESEALISSPDALLPAIRSDVTLVEGLRSSARYRERVFSRMLFAKLSECCPWVRGSL